MCTVLFADSAAWETVVCDAELLGIHYVTLWQFNHNSVWCSDVYNTLNLD